MDIERTKIVLLIWLCFGQVVLYVLIYIVYKNFKKTGQWSWRSFMPEWGQQESPETIELKIISFDEAFEAKVVTDETGIIQTINKKAVLLLGYKKSEIKNMHLELLVPSYNRNKLKDQLHRDMGQKIEESSNIMTIVKKNSYEFHAEVTTIKKQINKAFYYLFVIKDRTKEELLLKKYRQDIEIYKFKLGILSKGEELGNTGSWVWDLGADKITMSDGYKFIVGFGKRDPNEVPSSELRGRVWKSSEEKVKAALGLAFSGKRYEITYQQKRPSDFSIITVKSVVDPILNDDGEPIGFHGHTTLLSRQELTEVI